MSKYWNITITLFLAVSLGLLVLGIFIDNDLTFAIASVLWGWLCFAVARWELLNDYSR